MSKTKGTELEGTAPKKTKSDISPCDIKNSALFHANYKNHRINPKKHSFVCTSGWNDSAGKLEIAAWLKVVASAQVQMYSRIIRNSEAALYPLIITALLPVFDLCDCTASGDISTTIGLEAMEQVAGEIAESQSRNSSRQTSVEQTEPGASLASVPPADESSLPETIRTTDEAEVLKFMVFVEKWLNSTVYSTKGRVEILISDSSTGKIVAVVEAKPHISNNEPDDAGFYQCCAYMALRDVPFGIFTDHKAFQFVRMSEDKVLHHSQLFDLMKSEYNCLDQDAIDVYAHLFEIMGVPRSTNLLTKATECAAKWTERAELLTSRLA